ncbi:carbohydrate sulfotransferase 11-like [Ischnura elegans]|uniref:carbohydrate sulfotransferase 11-like n=1 Tax=Ischnura elegans TaxID=197161 RepID=UPI001ED87BCC|nr:carbohydrate sulfotransferase 11-like [Ischnura elegans]XP_046387639.1 carbohydrate sulfotransferase 11-like [Ischnura elegans]
MLFRKLRMGLGRDLGVLVCWGRHRRAGRGFCTLLAAASTTACLLLYLTAISAPSAWDKQAEDAVGSNGWNEEETRHRMRDARLDNDKRLRQIEQVCRRHNLGLYRQSAKASSIKHPPTPQYSVFYIDKPHKLAWCPIYKAASSTWLYNFLILGGVSEESLKTPKEQLSVLARRIYPEPEYSEAEEAFRTNFVFMVVRHPFERLLSAYRDKLENSKVGLEHGVLHFYEKYGRRIVSKYRFNRTLGRDAVMDLKEERIEPTFQEFVRYLIDEDLTRADDHWIPYYLFCTPCLLRYDFIAKVETMQRDQEYVIRSSGLLGEKGIQPRWRHQTRGGRSVGDTAKLYFSQLTVKEIMALYNKYSLDFELFGYNPAEYLHYAKDG